MQTAPETTSPVASQRTGDNRPPHVHQCVSVCLVGTRELKESGGETKLPQLANIILGYSWVEAEVSFHHISFLFSPRCLLLKITADYFKTTFPECNHSVRNPDFWLAPNWRKGLCDCCANEKDCFVFLEINILKTLLQQSVVRPPPQKKPWRLTFALAIYWPMRRMVALLAATVMSDSKSR